MIKFEPIFFGTEMMFHFQLLSIFPPRCYCHHIDFPRSVVKVPNVLRKLFELVASLIDSDMFHLFQKKKPTKTPKTGIVFKKRAQKFTFFIVLDTQKKSLKLNH